MADIRLSIAKPDIAKVFENQRANLFTRSGIGEILSQQREFWRVSESTSLNEFIRFLLEETNLKEARLQFPSRQEIRYVWGNASTSELVLSLKPDSYFSHYTAMFLHGLTEQIPNTIYLNHEQAPKPYRETSLDQISMDTAFQRPARVSRNIASYKDQKICILNGMYTGKLGVIDITGPDDERIDVTDVERTLIDATVRPVYSGGVFEVLNAYRMAKGTVSVNKLAAMLRRLNYTYPYHQAIGFYLERTGVYKDSSLALLRKFEIKYDFYLTHQIKQRAYSKAWRLYYPQGL
jgi:predicted transcriptional regulator of viral defense system